MSDARPAGSSRSWAFAIALAGVLLVLYPAVRPFSDEVTLEGAAAFAAGAWILAHTLAMIGFTLLTLGFLAVYLRLGGTRAGRLALRSLVIWWVGLGLVLPYYGAEAFALHAIGQAAMSEQNVALVRLAGAVRTGPGLPIFGIGLVLMGVGAVMMSVAVWKSKTLPGWAAVLVAIGFALYIPQFAAGQLVRVIHGAVIAVGCIWLAAGMLRGPAEGDVPVG
jgi:hypothetical protein